MNKTFVDQKGKVVVTNDPVLSPFLTKLERTFLKASFGEKISEELQPKALKIILGYISKAFTDTGLVPAGYNPAQRKDTLGLITKMVYADISHYFPFITVEEIGLAISNGIRHAYGQYNGINAVNINMFVKKYLEDPDRKSAIIKQKNYQESFEEKPKRELTQEEKNDIGLWAINNCLESYKKNGEFLDAGKLAYNHAVATGLINLTLEEKYEIYEQAVDIVDAEQEKNRFYNRFSRPSDSDLQFFYKSKAMDLSLVRYFEYLKKIESGEISKPDDI